MSHFPVEICIDARDDAAVRTAASAARLGGADRIELCSAMHLDGLTPDPRHIGIARDAFRDRPGLLVMVRPRDGDFSYDADEIDLMAGQIELAHQHRADGVVFGVLRASDSRIAVAPMRRLVDVARGRDLAVTCHRALTPRPTRTGLSTRSSTSASTGC
ncbi:MAG: copper homeostasis protein CutC [Caldilineales bacterium]